MHSPDKRAVGLPASLAASPSNIVNKNNTHYHNYANVALNSSITYETHHVKQVSKKFLPKMACVVVVVVVVVHLHISIPVPFSSSSSTSND